MTIFSLDMNFYHLPIVKTIHSFFRFFWNDKTCKSFSYEGDLDCCNVPNGQGVLRYSNGNARYVGHFVSGIFHGKGTLYEKNNNVSYQGDWVAGKRHGYGRMNLPDNFSYEGDWENDDYSGYGILRYKNLIFYAGFFSNGKFHGRGNQYFICQCCNKHYIVYDGEWCNGVRKGFGICFDLFTSEITGEPVHYLSYTGEINNGKPHGDGTLFYPKRHEHDKLQINYKGSFQKGIFHGNGVLFNRQNRKEYQGLFCKGLKHGYGISFHENGTILYSGLFFFGKSYGDINKIIEFKQDNFILSNLEKNNVDGLKKIDVRILEEFLKKKYHIPSSECSNQNIIERLCTVYRQKKCETITDVKYDLFGNRIKIPVMGSDDIIYDKSSLDYLFLKDNENKYVNVPYTFLDGTWEPKFPITSNGKTLSSYKNI